MKTIILFLSAFILVLTVPVLQAQESQVLRAMHAISSHDLMGYVNELCADKYSGRLTGTPEYNAAAQWLADMLKGWKVKPAGGNGTYFQSFPNPYTLVLPGSELALHIPLNKSEEIVKKYIYEDDYFPGATSDSGQVTAPVVYVGYGVTAPELKYDDYRGVDVKGKIALVEVEVPVSPDKDVELFKKWRPYSFHQKKIEIAVQHGAAGMIYHYHITNPNARFVRGFQLVYAGDSVVQDLFAGTGRNHRATVEAIKKELRPRSFEIGKTVTIKSNTRHHPEGVGINVVGFIEGSDPDLKSEALVIAAHLDHLGKSPELLPGANDDASGVSVIMGVAQALAQVSPPKRSVYLVFFGAEEQGVVGSEYFVQHLPVAREKIKGVINLDGVGRGGSIRVQAARNFPKLWEPFERCNNQYVHRELQPTFWANIARQRLDAAHFMWAGIPTLSLSTYGAAPLPVATYHTTHDTPEILTPEIMEDLSQLIFLVVLDLANQKDL